VLLDEVQHASLRRWLEARIMDRRHIGRIPAALAAAVGA